MQKRKAKKAKKRGDTDPKYAPVTISKEAIEISNKTKEESK